MATARARFQAHADGLPMGDLPFSVSWSIPVTSGEVLANVSLAIGANTFTAPPVNTLAIFIPPPDNLNTIALTGTSWNLVPNVASILPVPGTQTWSLTVTGGAINGCTIVYL